MKKINNENEELISELKVRGALKTPSVIRAFQKVKRADFVPAAEQAAAYADIPLPIGGGQTISQPFTVAFMLENLRPAAGDKILDVGSGSGWTTALLAEIAGAGGKVYALEIISELKKQGEKNVSKYNYIEDGVVQFFCSDGRKGLPRHAPFDKILVSAATAEIPEALLKQLKVGGRMIIPVGEKSSLGDLVLAVKKGENEFEKKIFPGFIFVPLVE